MIDWTIPQISEAAALSNAIRKAVGQFPHLAKIKDRQTLARNACTLAVAHLSGPELLALSRAAGPLELA